MKKDSRLKLYLSMAFWLYVSWIRGLINVELVVLIETLEVEAPEEAPWGARLGPLR